MSIKIRCKAIRKGDNKPCEAPAYGDSDFCSVHKHQARLLSVSGTPAKPMMTAEDIIEASSRLIHAAVEMGDVDGFVQLSKAHLLALREMRQPKTVKEREGQATTLDSLKDKSDEELEALASGSNGHSRVHIA